MQLVFLRQPLDLCLAVAALLKVGNEDPAYRAAERIANSVLCNNLEDLTGGADSYQVIGTNAVWSRGLTPVKTIGHHEFYITRKGGA